MASSSNVNETSSVASSAPVASPSAAARVRPKNAKGNKTDPAWEYAVSIEPGSRRVQCKFCQLAFSGSAYRVRHHLAGTSRDVAVCPSVPPDVKKVMQDKVGKLQKKLLEKANSRFLRMFEYVAKHGIGFKPPSYHEIRVKYLNVGQGASIGDVLGDDLELPSIDEGDNDDDEVEENEDEYEDEYEDDL